MHALMHLHQHVCPSSSHHGPLASRPQQEWYARQPVLKHSASPSPCCTPSCCLSPARVDRVWQEPGGSASKGGSCPPPPSNISIRSHVVRPQAITTAAGAGTALSATFPAPQQRAEGSGPDQYYPKRLHCSSHILPTAPSYAVRCFQW